MIPGAFRASVLASAPDDVRAELAARSAP